jgi:hypothetical protein
MTTTVSDTGTDTLDQAVAGLSGAVDRLEAGVVMVFEALAQASRQQLQQPNDPAVLREPLVRAAGIRLEDVNLDQAVVDGPAAVAATDPQAAFVTLAEQLGSYQVAAREHPEVWAAARAAADLRGSADGDDPNAEVARLVEEAMADHGLNRDDATYLVMYQRPDLWHRTRGVRT